MKTARLAALTLALTATAAAATLPVRAQEDGEPSAVTAEDVTAIFKIQYASYCSTLMMGDGTPPEPKTYPLAFRYAYEDESDDLREWTLYEYECTIGAYNVGSVFYTVDEYDEIHALQFAFPEFDVVNADPEDYESEVTNVRVTGFSAREVLVFPEFDIESLELTQYSRWRGLGDASSFGRWQFRDGVFVLKTYEVDPTYDGEVNLNQIYPDNAYETGE
ncbi:DUF1176 domain-containing protein [Cucumibacter marinus]|uniref:DUF1176 domain-containing protein n=1 Tax=Cucumibacter marinus TaxID=1121252 RepID=UPI0003FC3D95|nr:DUF1176 domain-containing protein [Cucumibacter marinus]